MAWTTPRTWVAGEIVTAAQLNTHVRDDLNILKSSINDDGTLRGWTLLDRVFTETADLTNSTTETSMYSYSVPGGTLSTNNFIQLLASLYVDVSTLSLDLNIRVKFGGTTIASGAFTLTASTKGPILVEVLINANNATNQQRSAVRVTVPNAAPADGSVGAAIVLGAAHSSLAIDTTSAQTLEITAQWSTTSVNSHLKRWAAATHRLKAA